MVTCYILLQSMIIHFWEYDESEIEACQIVLGGEIVDGVTEYPGG